MEDYDQDGIHPPKKKLFIFLLNISFWWSWTNIYFGRLKFYILDTELPTHNFDISSKKGPHWMTKAKAKKRCGRDRTILGDVSLWESVHTHLDRSEIDLSSLWESVHRHSDRFGLRSISDRSNSLVWMAPKINTSWIDGPDSYRAVSN